MHLLSFLLPLGNPPLLLCVGEKKERAVWVEGALLYPKLLLLPASAPTNCSQPGPAWLFLPLQLHALCLEQWVVWVCMCVLGQSPEASAGGVSHWLPDRGPKEFSGQIKKGWRESKWWCEENGTINEGERVHSSFPVILLVRYVSLSIQILFNW